MKLYCSCGEQIDILLDEKMRYPGDDRHDPIYMIPMYHLAWICDPNNSSDGAVWGGFTDEDVGKMGQVFSVDKQRVFLSSCGRTIDTGIKGSC